MRTDLLQGGILFVNSVAILNNDRFLEKSKLYTQVSSFCAQALVVFETSVVQLAGVIPKLVAITWQHTLTRSKAS